MIHKLPYVWWTTWVLIINTSRTYITFELSNLSSPEQRRTKTIYTIILAHAWKNAS